MQQLHLNSLDNNDYFISLNPEKHHHLFTVYRLRAITI